MCLSSSSISSASLWDRRHRNRRRRRRRRRRRWWWWWWWRRRRRRRWTFSSRHTSSSSSLVANTINFGTSQRRRRRRRTRRRKKHRRRPLPTYASRKVSLKGVCFFVLFVVCVRAWIMWHQKSAGSGRIKNRKKTSNRVCVTLTTVFLAYLCVLEKFNLSDPTHHYWRQRWTTDLTRTTRVVWGSKNEKRQKAKKKKRKKRWRFPCTQKLFSLIKSLRDLLYIFPPRTQSTNERFFSFDIALFADSTTECVCVREKEVSSTHGQLKRARSKSTRKDYLNKNLEKKAKAD